MKVELTKKSHKSCGCFIFVLFVLLFEYNYDSYFIHTFLQGVQFVVQFGIFIEKLNLIYLQNGFSLFQVVSLSNLLHYTIDKKNYKESVDSVCKFSSPKFQSFFFVLWSFSRKTLHVLISFFSRIEKNSLTHSKLFSKLTISQTELKN